MKNCTTLLNFFGSVFSTKPMRKNDFLGNTLQARKNLQKQFLLMPLMVFAFLFTNGNAWGQTTKTAIANGNWSDAATWSPSGVPASNDNVIIDGDQVTVTANASCGSLTFTTGTTSQLTVNSNVTLTVTNTFGINSIGTASRSASVTGGGTISCGSFFVGSNLSTFASDVTTTLTSSISNISSAGDLTIFGNDDGSSENNATLNLQSGTVQVASVSMTAENTSGSASSATLNLNSGTANGTLKINGAIPFSAYGTGTITRTLNGTSSTIEYNRAGDQTVLNTTYRNLTITDSGVKTTGGATTVAGTLTVNSGATLATATTLTTTSATVNINGSFQINQGGFASGGTWTYGAAGTLIYNNSTGPYGAIDAGHNYWPSTNGPVNVTVQNGGGINMGVSRTVTGTFLLVTGTNAVQGTALTLNGTTRINGGNFQTTPTYGPSSTLAYNTTYGTSNEWTGGASTSVAAGSGVPANVTVESGTLTLGGGRGVPGNITVNSSCGLVLNSTSGDLYIGGNLTNNGSTWTNNTRAVIFVGTGTSVITNGGVTQFFDYLLIQKTSGSVQLSSAGSGTNVTINTTAGDVLQLLGAASLDLNGRTLTLANAGGNIATNGSGRTITSGVTGGRFVVSGSKTVTSTSSGTLIFAANVTVALSAGLNFGASLSTVNGTLEINSGGFVNTNAPIYGSGSTLIYNSGTSYGRGLEWSATSGAGYPYHVTLQGNTTLDLGNGGIGTARQMAGNLTVTNGSTLTLNNSGNVMTAALTVIGSVNNNLGGIITLSSSIGGDIKVEGDIIDNGTFNFNNRAIFFQGNNTQSIQGSGTFDIPFVRINKGAGSVKMLANLTCIGVNSANSMEIQGTTSILDLNGYTLNLGAVGNSSTFNSGITTAGYIKGSSTSTITILGSGSLGTLLFDQSIPGTTNVLNNLTVNRDFATGNDLVVYGILDAGSSSITGAGGITLPAAATLITSNASGVNGAIATSGSNSLSTSANYTFTGSTAQTTGTNLPATVNDFTITNTAGVTLPQSLTVSHAMSISGTGTSLTINPNTILTIAGTADFGGKSVTLKSDATGTAAIGQVTGSLTGATNVTVERYIPAKRAWRALTAPLKGSNISLYASWQNGGVSASPFTTGVELWGPSGTGMATGPAYNIRQYTTSGWADITNTQNTNLFTSSANNAYMVFVTGGYGSDNIGNGQSAATTLKATGQLITGTVNYSLSSTNHTLIGNPFASPISPAAILSNTANTNTALLFPYLWVWNPAYNTNGAYELYDKVAGTYSGGNLSAGTAIQSGQAFFVRTETASSSLTLTESMKSSSISNTFRNSNSVSPSIVRASFLKQTALDWMPLDGCIAAFYEGANPAADDADGKKMINTGENIGFVRNAVNLSSEHYPLVTTQDIMYLKVWNTQQAHYKLKLNTEEFTMTGVEAYLQDLYTGTTQPLNLDGSVQDYEFDVDPTVSASSGNRFRIVFTNTALAVTNPEQGQLSIYPNPASSGKVTISLPTGTFEGCSYELLNVLGQVVRQDEIANANSSQVSIPLTGLPNSWYALRIRKDNKVVYQGKLIINN